MLRALKNKLSGISSLKKFTLLLCAFLILTISIGTSISYVVTGTPTLINLFLNGMNPDGDLVIHKTVSHPFGDTYTVPEDLSFTFAVDLGGEYAGQTLKTTQGEKTANENGRFTVTVTPGGRTTVYDIDEGTPVTVTETQIGKGFTPDAESQDITIQKYQDNLLTFANTYTPEKADTSALTVSGVKTLAGREWIEGDSFTFDLSVYQNGAWSSLGTQTITYELVEQADPEDPEKTVLVPKPDFDRFDFSELIRGYAFDAAGTYSFRITEVEGTIGGITYDEMESKFEILVGDADMDGYLEIQSVTTMTPDNTTVENTTVSISFENKYAPVGSTEGLIEIQKVLEDTSGQGKSPAGYTFELYDEAGALLATSDPTGSNGETAIRLVYEPTDAGKTFTYVLKETGGGQTVGALTYDGTEYKIQVSIVDNLDGTVSAYIYDWQEPVESTQEAAESTEESTEAASVETEPEPETDAPLAASEPATVAIPEGVTDTYKAAFTNKYDPQEASVSLGGQKTLSGRVLKDGEFAFLLYKTDGLFTLTEGMQPIERVTNTAGAFHFDALTFNKVGTYYYVVAEDVSGALGGVTYDNARFLVTIVVTDEDGVLTAKTTITDHFGEAREIQFANQYQAAPVSLSLGGRKTLTGAALKDYTFRFQLSVADENFVAGETAFQTAVSHADGEFAFDDLAFTKAGTYRYMVTEDDSAAVEGMSYDDTVYCITVNVTDPGDGKLEIGEFRIEADGQKVSEIHFENSYVAPTEPEEPTTEEPTTEAPSVPEEPTTEEPSVPEEPTTEEPTTGESKPVGPGGTDTGDRSNAGLFAALLALGLATMIALLVARRRARRR